MPAPAGSYIFDTSVLSAFAVVEQLDLLEQRYAGQATWKAEVFDELVRGVAREPRLGAILAAQWLGSPSQSFDVVAVERIRVALGGKSEDPYLHLGEAATIAAAIAEGHVFAVDDYDATRYAWHVGVETINTIAILRAHVHDATVSAEFAVALVDEMIDACGRRLPRVGVDAFQP